jgi:Zn-dependent peptidase ImmA (M78 family)
MNPLARANAVNLINKYYFQSPLELDLENLLYAEGLFLKEEELIDCEGKIIFDSLNGIITVDSLNKNEKQKRFTIAHEMGHFFNERNLKSTCENIFYKCSYDEIHGEKSNSNREANANKFAAELLMHDRWFTDFVKGKKLNAKLLQETSEYFNVSLSAIATRYAEIGTHPAAIVFCKKGIIKWSVINKGFPFQFIEWNRRVSNLSYVYDIFEGKEYPKDGEDVPTEAWFNNWNKDNRLNRVNELNFYMKNYNSVLTVLWFS